MSTLADSVGATVAVITAMGAFGTAASGLVDATKAFGGGLSNVGLPYIMRSLTPFRAALEQASAAWRETLRANWINGVPKEEQKAAVKTLIRLGLSSTNVSALARAARVDEARLAEAMERIEEGRPLSTGDVQLFGRLNAVIDAAMDAGFERADQAYRNTCKVCALLFAVGLALWAGWLLRDAPPVRALAAPVYVGSRLFWWAIFAGVISVPIAPIAKDLASSLQAAANAVTVAKP